MTTGRINQISRTNDVKIVSHATPARLLPPLGSLGAGVSLRLLLLTTGETAPSVQGGSPGRLA